MKADHAVQRVASTGNAVKQASYNNQGSGTVNMAANLENQKRLKKGSVNAFQNAISMMQAQTQAIGQADKIYSKMLSLAQMATDPIVSDADRAVLSDQFNSLRDHADSIANSRFNNKLMFDPLAASKQYNVSFGDGQLKVLINPGGQAISPYEEVDVLYNKGKMTIDVNGGGNGETYTLWQGNQKLFDTGNWRTHGWASDWDYDRFIVEFGPQQETTFQFVPLSAGNGSHVDSLLDPPGYPNNLTDDGIYQNKNKYLSQLGLTDDGSTSGVESINGQKFTQKGQVSAFTINSESSLLRLQVDSTSIFQVKGSFELPDLEDEVVGRDDDLQVKLQKVGLGLLRVDDQVSGFPVISIDTAENAQKAIDSLTGEINGLGEQLGKLGSNFNRVQNAIEGTKHMKQMSDEVLSGLSDHNLTNDLLQLSKSRIARAHDTSLLTQAMSIHQDLVNVLI
jgi:flagellin-like hook-associated protein FlgL